jgi:endonuclease/exonuclease/phosphatase (EEP) superfamily protein YafD
LLVAAAALGARQLPVTNHGVLILAVLAPYLMFGAAMSAVLLLLTGRRLAAVLALVVFAASVVVQAPQFLGSRRPTQNTAPIRVLTANLRDGSAEPESVAAAARDHADVLFVQELSPDLAQTLTDRYLHRDFPYQALKPGRFAVGVGIWSRYPIAQASLISGFALGAVRAIVRPPDARSEVVVASVHLVAPWPQAVDAWSREIAALPQTLERLAATAGRGPVIVAGDLNATADLKPFRRLLETGFRDAGGRFGFTATYPADMPIPPLLQIDHILTLNSSATDAHAVRIDGSDHKALGATVYVPAKQ